MKIIEILQSTWILTLFLCLTAKAATTSSSEGLIRIDGSSTVFPITEAVAEEFASIDPKIRVNVGVSGTGGGFKKFTIKETDISNASRVISHEEKAVAAKNHVSYVEIPVAHDGITLVVNPKNTWANDLTAAELKKIWAPNSPIKKWKDVRSTWPDAEIKLYGPGTDSGTFDYFAEVLGTKPAGNAKNAKPAIRSDFVKSEDDNVLVRAVAGDINALGFFGFAYYVENKTQLKALSLDGVMPAVETIRAGTYKPLSRLIYIYVNKESLKHPHVKKFVDFYIQHAATLSKEVGYVPLEASQYEKSLKAL